MAAAICVEEDARCDPADCDDESWPDFGELVNPGDPERGYAVENVEQHREQDGKCDKLDSEAPRLLKARRSGEPLKVENFTWVYRVAHAVDCCPFTGNPKRGPAEERHEREGDDAKA